MKYPNQFKEGNPIYCPTVTHRICQVKFMGVDKLRIDEETPFQIYTNGCNPYHMPVIFHATQENYELLSKLYPNVSFEPPPKREEPKEIIKAMLESGWKFVSCRVCNIKAPTEISGKVLVHKVNYDSHSPFKSGRNTWKYATPFDPKTGKTIIDFVDGEVVLESEDG